MEVFYVLILISLCSLVIMTIYSGVMLLILNNNKLYCKYYKGKDYKLWEKFIKNADAFSFEYDYRIYSKYACTTPLEWCFIGEVDGVKYRIIKFQDSNGVGIFNTEEDLILSDFDEYHSKKMKDILLSNLTEEIRNKGNEEFIRKNNLE